MSYSAQISFSGSLVSMNDRPKVDSALNEVFGEDSLSVSKIQETIENYLDTKSILNLNIEIDNLNKMDKVNFNTMSDSMLEELVFTIERLFLIKINLIEYFDNSSELMFAELANENKITENRYIRANMQLKIVIFFQSLIIMGLLVGGVMYMVAHHIAEPRQDISSNGKWTIPNTVDRNMGDRLPSLLPTPPGGIKGPANVDLTMPETSKPPQGQTIMPQNAVTEIKP
jgi:hypothetical protein